MREALFVFTQKENCPLRELIANDPGETEERVRLNSVEVKNSLQRQLEYCPALENLNQSQRRAVETSVGHRIHLVWGPPGTGKTQVAAAILRMNVEAQKNADEARCALLAVGQSNVAADNLAWRCIQEKLHVTRFGDAKIMSQDLLDISTQKLSAEWGNKTLEDLHRESTNARKKTDKGTR